MVLRKVSDANLSAGEILWGGDGWCGRWMIVFVLGISVIGFVLRYFGGAFWDLFHWVHFEISWGAFWDIFHWVILGFILWYLLLGYLGI